MPNGAASFTLHSVSSDSPLSIKILLFTGSDGNWPVSPVSRGLVIVYVLIGLPIMYLFVSSIGQLFARIINFVILKLDCGSKSQHSTRSKRRSLKLNGNNASGASPKDDKHFSMGQLSSSGNGGTTLAASVSGRRNTWQTKGSLHSNSATGLIGSNGSLASGLHTYEDNGLIVTRKGPKTSVYIGVSSMIMTTFILCSLCLVSQVLDWTFGEAMYFSFLMFFTIGMGGLNVPENNMWLVPVMMLISLSVLSTCFFVLKNSGKLRLGHRKQGKRRLRGTLKRSSSTAASNGSVSTTS